MIETCVKKDGIIPVNKPKDITSYDVIRALKRRARFDRIGHAGTLDPIAEGVLLVLVGRATALFKKLSALEKTYTAGVVFGLETDTDDITGKVTSRSEARPTRAAAEDTLRALTGDIYQTPPAYSALKYRGRKLYEYAREGKPVDAAARKVSVRSIDILSFSEDGMLLRVVCSGGTYVRALARDFGRRAGCLAALGSLRRDRIGGFDVSMCADMDVLEKAPLEKLIIGIDEKSDYVRFF
jgi:tRNA pseudouridine55 synthase